MEEQIFKAGSKTYYNASKLFPENTWADVAKLYSFVRVADDYIDATPQKVNEFNALKALWEQSVQSGIVHPKLKSDIIGKVVANMLFLVQERGIAVSWVNAFLDSMEMDIKKASYKTMQDLIIYMYGSAEVIGLMMAQIMNLPKEAHEPARLQGRAMQLINFIRDIAEDNKLGRCYLPEEEYRSCGLADLSKQTAMSNLRGFHKFVQKQLAYYHQWQNEANAGFRYIPRKQRIAIRVAVDGYNWTASRIAKNPLYVYEKKLKPPSWYLKWRGIVRSITG